MMLSISSVAEPLPGGLDPTLFALALPLVVGLVQLAKEVGLPSRWGGVAALALGMACGLLLPLASVGDAPPARAALTGLVAGLSAAGAWSTGKALVQVQVQRPAAHGEVDAGAGTATGTGAGSDLRRT